MKNQSTTMMKPVSRMARHRSARGVAVTREDVMDTTDIMAIMDTTVPTDLTLDLMVFLDLSLDLTVFLDLTLDRTASLVTPMPKVLLVASLTNPVMNLSKVT